MKIILQSDFSLNCHFVRSHYDPGKREEMNIVNESNIDKDMEHKVRAVPSLLLLLGGIHKFRKKKHISVLCHTLIHQEFSSSLRFCTLYKR